MGRDLGISKDIRFAITDYATKNQGDDYGTITNKAKAAALEKSPRHSVWSAKRR